jgi:hypothetical protein
MARAPDRRAGTAQDASRAAPGRQGLAGSVRFRRSCRTPALAGCRKMPQVALCPSGFDDAEPLAASPLPPRPGRRLHPAPGSRRRRARNGAGGLLIHPASTRRENSHFLTDDVPSHRVRSQKSKHSAAGPGPRTRTIAPWGCLRKRRSELEAGAPACGNSCPRWRGKEGNRNGQEVPESPPSKGHHLRPAHGGCDGYRSLSPSHHRRCEAEIGAGGLSGLLRRLGSGPSAVRPYQAVRLRLRWMRAQQLTDLQFGRAEG